jgi:hypothetical protein
MTNPTPTERATIEQQFADVDASFRLEGFEKSAYSESITAAIAGGALTHEEAIAQIVGDAKQGAFSAAR